MNISEACGILGINKNDDIKDAKKKYRKLAAKHHPDKNGGSEESTKQFKRVQQAWDMFEDYKKNPHKHSDTYGGYTGKRDWSGFNYDDFDDIFNYARYKRKSSYSERDYRKPAKTTTKTNYEKTISLKDLAVGKRFKIKFKRLEFERTDNIFDLFVVTDFSVGINVSLKSLDWVTKTLSINLNSKLSDVDLGGLPRDKLRPLTITIKYEIVEDEFCYLMNKTDVSEGIVLVKEFPFYDLYDDSHVEIDAGPLITSNSIRTISTRKLRTGQYVKMTDYLLVKKSNGTKYSRYSHLKVPVYIKPEVYCPDLTPENIDKIKEIQKSEKNKK